MLITTMNDIPGYSIDEVYGEVFGLTVRSRNIGSTFGAGGAGTGSGGMMGGGGSSFLTWRNSTFSALGLSNPWLACSVATTAQPSAQRARNSSSTCTWCCGSRWLLGSSSR